MSRLLALGRRELFAYFYAPVPYLVMFLFLLMTAFMFWLGMSQDAALITYDGVLSWLAFALLFLIPMLTMNSVAEERSRNTLETLLTAPVHDWQVIAAKWGATFAFYVFMLLPTLIYWPILATIGESIGKPETGPILSGYLGALLLGGLYIAIGIFASSLTENSLLSAFLAFFTSIGLMIVNLYTGDSDPNTPQFIREAGGYLTPQGHFESFVQGKVAVYDLIYFVSMTLLFLFLAVRSLESRKWR